MWRVAVIIAFGFLPLCVEAMAQQGEVRVDNGGLKGVYRGVAEFEKGEGIFVLEDFTQSFPATPNAWGTAVAEFIRRHPDRRIITIASIAEGLGHRGWNNWTKGLVIVTALK